MYLEYTRSCSSSFKKHLFNYKLYIKKLKETFFINQLLYMHIECRTLYLVVLVTVVSRKYLKN